MNLEHIYRDLLQKRQERQEYNGTIKGTCQEYCPYFEYIERNLRGDINKYEKNILVKKYNRSSAGKVKPFPEDVRPINVLVSVLEYLLQFCDFTLESYKFLENRTRAIRLDITIQELECDRTIYVLEKICRLLIVYSYALYDNKEFEIHLNLEQCKKILGTLIDLYNKRNKYNEEFIGYHYLISFDEKFIVYNTFYKSKNILFSAIKCAYLQNNLYIFFKLVRSTDFLSYCILHTYFDKVRLKGIEIYSKCFVEKIDANFINKMLYLTVTELKSLCKKMNIQLINDSTILVDFKNKDLFENDNILIKERKSIIRTSKLIYYGDIDYYIKDYIVKMWIIKNFTKTYKPIINAKIMRKKVKFNIFSDPHETQKDIFDVLVKIYCKISASIFVKDIKKRVIIFEKKKKLAREICFYILDLYIKNRLKSPKGSVNVKTLVQNTLCIVTDDTIFSAIFVNTVKKSVLMNYKPDFLQYKNMNISTLLKYKVSIFALNKKLLVDTNTKYYMLNKMVDTPQNMGKNIDKILELINISRYIIKNKLNLLLENKSRLKQISILTCLIHNGRNPDVKEDWINKIDKKQKLENIEVYYEEGIKMY